MKFVYLCVLLVPILSAVLMKAIKSKEKLNAFCLVSFSVEVLLCLPV